MHKKRYRGHQFFKKTFASMPDKKDLQIVTKKQINLKWGVIAAKENVLPLG